ncbi:MAG: alpha/beta hydrolase [Lacunisphaera sp.]|nr:alpha/beta hydrolase [Lacunisphaera sp.]
MKTAVTLSVGMVAGVIGWTVGVAQTTTVSSLAAATAAGPLSEFSVEPKETGISVTADYVPVPINVGFPMRVLDDGTVILGNNSNNIYAYRWRQGVATALSFVRPTGTRFRVQVANRNGMVAAVFEYPTAIFIDGVYTKQVVAVWLPNASTPTVLNVPVARATVWPSQHAERTVEFKYLDDLNRIWANVAYEVSSEEGTNTAKELARWDDPTAAPQLIGHGKFGQPSVLLLGVSSGGGEPFGYYAPPDGEWNAFVPFAGELTNTLNFTPSMMNSQGWVLGKRGSAPVLYRSGAEYALPADNSIEVLDDRNNVYDWNRLRLWTTDPQTLISTPENPQTPFRLVPFQPIVLPEGYSSNHRVVPGDSSFELDYVIRNGVGSPALMVPAELRPDANRDGVITVGRGASDPDRALAEAGLPWHFWLNDDDDSGETDGTDIPGKGSNGADGAVNGVRDLVDFFPVHLDIRSLLKIFPADDAAISYKLVQADGAANYLTTDLTADTAGIYQRDAEKAKLLGGAPVTPITAEGVALDRAFLGKVGTAGIILIEAGKATDKPLRLEAWRGAEQLARLELPLKFGGVETMFRHVNLARAVGIACETPNRGGAPNWPDALNNKKAFLFVHGYNVNQQQARGWEAEIFKRLWWSGSRAQFWGVTWCGYESQVPVARFTPNYQQNVIHAFGTAPQLANFIGKLRADQPGLIEVGVAAHSLGNMVVSSAISDYQAPIDRYFMIDAAVAAEAYDGGQDSQVVQSDDGTAFLPHTEWNKQFDGVYPARLWATNWHKLFLSTDARSKLTWRDRFAPHGGTVYYDFHSTGEEVLGYDETHADNTPSLAGVLAAEIKIYLHSLISGQKGQPAGYQTWIYQEQLKGRTITGKVLGSNFGGWGFNIFHFRKFPGGFGKGPVETPTVLTPAEAASRESTLFTDQALREAPFFRPGGFFTKAGSWVPDGNGGRRFLAERIGQLYGINGSDFAARQRDALLARMIPAMSPATGRIPVLRLGQINLFNFDMNSDSIRPRKAGEANPPWPSTRATPNWWHSDLREVAYPYVRGVYDRIAAMGGLNTVAP